MPIINAIRWSTLIQVMAWWHYTTSHSTNKYWPQSIRVSTRQIWGIWKLWPAYSPETPNLSQNRWCFWLPWKTIGHLSFAVSSFVQHFIAIGEFKLELQSGNAQFGSNSMIFKSRVTLKFDGWPWKTIGHLFNATSSFVHHFVAIDDSKQEIQSRNAQFGSKSTIFRAVWPWNLTHDLEKQ